MVAAAKLGTGLTQWEVNPVPRTYVRGFGALPLQGGRNIHPVPTVLDGDASFSHDGVGTGFIPALTPIRQTRRT